MRSVQEAVAYLKVPLRTWLVRRSLLWLHCSLGNASRSRSVQRSVKLVRQVTGSCHLSRLESTFLWLGVTVKFGA